MKIEQVLTDNGSQFTARFTSQNQRASGNHAFDTVCAQFDIEHRLAPPRGPRPAPHPQTNGMVERFNGRISEVVAQTRFSCAAELQTTLTHYLSTYNHSIPQRTLSHQTPIQSLKIWQEKRPDLFIKRVHKQTGLNS